MGIWSRLAKTVRGGHHSEDIQEELQFHLDMDAADGHDYRQTRLRLGNMTRITEETRAVGIIEWLDSAGRDARYGVRQLLRTPALSLAVVLSLAIGLGANAAIFSLVDAAILKPLPVNAPDSLVILEWTNDGFPPEVENHNGEYIPIAEGRFKGSSIAAHLYRRLAREQTVFESLVGVAAYPDAVAIAVDTRPAEQASLQYVSSNYFQGLRVEPLLGRPFRDDEDRIGAEPAVIVEPPVLGEQARQRPARARSRHPRQQRTDANCRHRASRVLRAPGRPMAGHVRPPLDQGRVPARAAGRHGAGRERSQLVGSTGRPAEARDLGGGRPG